MHLNFVKTKKLNAFRQKARGKRQELGKRQEGKRDALDKKPNIRYFYKYGMLPAETPPETQETAEKELTTASV